MHTKRIGLQLHNFSPSQWTYILHGTGNKTINEKARIQRTVHTKHQSITWTSTDHTVHRTIAKHKHNTEEIETEGKKIVKGQ